MAAAKKNLDMYPKLFLCENNGKLSVKSYYLAINTMFWDANFCKATMAILTWFLQKSFIYYLSWVSEN